MTDPVPQIELDRALAAEVAAGERTAFDAFFREYFPRLYRFTLLRVDNDPDLAEEVVQRTMCIVVRKMATYRGEALLFSWLCTICRNELATLCRERGESLRTDVPIEDHPAVQAALESASAGDHRPESVQRGDEIRHFVRVTLEHLPANYSTALEMKYIGGYSVAEIAGRLELSEKAAESVLSRARAAFKEHFRALWDLEPGFVVD